MNGLLSDAVSMESRRSSSGFNADWTSLGDLRSAAASR